MSNTTHDAIDFSIDIETNRVASGIDKVPHRRSDGSIDVPHKLTDRQIRAEKQVVPIQFSSINHHRNSQTVVTVDNLETPSRLDLDIKHTFDSTSVFRGNNVRVKKHVAQVQNREDINRIFMEKNSKGKLLSSREKKYFHEVIEPHIRAHAERSEIFIEHTTNSGRKYFTSAWSNAFTERVAQDVHAESLTAIVNHIQIDPSSKVMTLDHFKDNFVNEWAGTIIDAANQRGAVNIGAWNAQFEADRIAGWIYNYADPKIKKDWFKLIKTDKIKWMSLEQSYLDVLWNMSKSNKEIVESAIIPYSASTFNEFGYRVGKTPRTIEEFASSASWSQDKVLATLDSWMTPLKQKAAAAGHYAPIDALRSTDINTFFRKIQDKAKSIASQRLAQSTTGVIDDSSIYNDAFKEVILGEGYASDAAESVDILDDFISRVVKDNKIKARSAQTVTRAISRSKAFGGGGGSGGGPFLGSVSKKLNNENFWRYGTLAAAAGLAIAATFFETNDFSTDNYGSKFGGIGKFKYSGVQSFDEFDDGEAGPFVFNHIGKVVGWTAATALGAGLIGLREAKLRLPILGFQDGFNIKTATVTDSIKQAGKLIKLGTNVIESHFPIARVFKAGAALDFLFNIGSSKGFKNRAGATVRKVLNVPLHNRFAPNDVGKVNIDSFMETAKVTNKVKAKKLQTLLDDTARFENVDKSVLTMEKTKNGKTIIRVTDYINGNAVTPQGFEKGIVFDIETAFVKTRRANLSGRNIHPTIRGVDETYHALRSSPAEDLLASEQFRNGQTIRKTFEEFYAQFRKPSYMSETVFRNYKYMQYMLDIGPKGIHLGEDIFNNTKALGKVRTFATAIGTSTDPTLNLKLKAKHIGMFGREFLQAGNRFLESPFEIMINPEVIKRTINSLKSSKSATKNIAGSILEKLEHTHLGLNINNMKYGSLEYVGKFAMKRVLPLGIGYYAFKTLDSLMGAATFSPTGRGPLTTVPNKIYQSGMLAYSKVSDILGLTTIAKNQEKFAPGSTGLGIFAFPAALAGTYSIADMIYKKSPTHAQGLVNKLGNTIMTGNRTGYKQDSIIAALASKINQNKYFRDAIRPEAFKGALNKSLGARAINAIMENPKKALFSIGAILSLPFLPGALGSTKTYQERKAEYKGQRDVAIRKNRGWMLSSSAFEGGAVGQYRQHGSYIAGSNYENRGVIWPSYSSRLLHAMTLGLGNRYVLEEYHKESQPVYETSPYGASVPVIGPLISQTIGRIVKPVRRMHTGFQDGTYTLNAEDDYSDNYKYIAERSTAEFIQLGTASTYNVATNRKDTGLDKSLIKSVGGFKQASAQLRNQVVDLVGFKGFALETVIRTATGQARPDEYQPYLKSAQEMYNPAQYMWQYDSGDFSIIGGEFLRRGLVSPRKKWEINDIPNELYGQEWIPKRFHQGTTFDKMPMGWLYASRKGWEFTYPEIRGMNMEDYPDKIKLDILKYMAPQSQQFKSELRRSTRQAVENKLTPFEEQRVYEAAEQSAEIKKKVWAHDREAQYDLDMETISGRLTSFNEQDMTFTTDEGGNRKYKLAGVTAAESQIRAGLLKTRSYDDAEELSSDARAMQEDILSKVRSTMQVGSKIDFKTPSNGNISGGMPEAIVGSLNQQLLNAGSPLLDTGNVSQFNMKQDQQPFGSELLSQYWNRLTDSNNVFKNKLIGNRDYITKFENDRVYNLPVKLWSRPIEHFLKPLIASALDNIGINLTPSFTKERRKNEQYWDVIKYIKYKTLATKASYSDNSEAAMYYQDLANKTMVGADPMSDMSSTKASLPSGDKDYFDFFANEPDPKRRGKIFSMISSPQKRIYNAIWTAKVAQSGAASKEELEKYQMMRDTGGYEVSEDIIKDWKSDTGGQSSLKDYVRARYVQQFIKNNDVPSSDWAGYDERVNIDNVELLSLEHDGFQSEDYGYFDEQRRSAAYDKMAYVSTQQLHSQHLSQSEFIGNMLPAMVSSSVLDSANGIPTSSQFPIQSSTIESDNYRNTVDRNRTLPPFATSGIDHVFMAATRAMRI